MKRRLAFISLVLTAVVIAPGSAWSSCFESAHPIPVRIDAHAGSAAFAFDVDDVSAFYPRRARRMETGGSIRLRCEVTAGRAGNCNLVSVSEPDVGFEGSALALSKRLSLPHDQREIEVVVTFAIVGPRPALIPCRAARPISAPSGRE
ncbi:MAG: hypothetical protein Q7J28_11025 [Caulobacter sp.]|nr:hypothetical protein [Caulobacter sp.]